MVDLGGLTIPLQCPPIRVEHNTDRLVGHTYEIAQQHGRLVASGIWSIPGPDTERVVAGSPHGFPWQASIGARGERCEFVKDGQVAAANGRELPGPVVVLRKGTLGKVSFVDLGADGRTSATVAATKPSGDAAVNNQAANTEGTGTASLQSPVPGRCATESRAGSHPGAGGNRPHRRHLLRPRPPARGDRSAGHPGRLARDPDRAGNPPRRLAGPGVGRAGRHAGAHSASLPTRRRLRLYWIFRRAGPRPDVRAAIRAE